MKKIVVTGVLISFILIGCFSPWKGDEASIILSLGGSAGNRSVWPHEEDPDILNEIVYNVIIDGHDYKEINSIGGMTVKTTVTPGIYTITIEAWYLNEHYAKGSLENITITAGINNITFPLTAWIPDIYPNPDMDPNKTYLIAEGINMEFNSLSDALSAAQASSDTELEIPGMYGLGLEEFTISISDREHFLNSDTGVIEEGHKVTIKNHGNGTAYIKHDNEIESGRGIGYIFLVYGELTLQGNITLMGFDGNYSTLINVYGILNMNDNVKITGNIRNGQGGDSGGGVCVRDGGTFNMSGGEISGNKEFGFGGGVYVEEGGTFYIEAGIISNNKALYRGGGVCVAEGGRFRMSGGIISGNEVSNSISITASGGGGVFIAPGAYFRKTQGTIYGYGDNAGVYDESLCNHDLNGAHSVFLGNDGKNRDTTVWPDDSLVDVPEDGDDW